jgi:hypothetical protein
MTMPVRDCGRVRSDAGEAVRFAVVAEYSQPDVCGGCDELAAITRNEEPTRLTPLVPSSGSKVLA